MRDRNATIEGSNPTYEALDLISNTNSFRRVQTTRSELNCSVDSTESRRFIVVVSLHTVSIFETTILWNSVSSSLSLFFV